MIRCLRCESDEMELLTRDVVLIPADRDRVVIEGAELRHCRTCDLFRPTADTRRRMFQTLGVGPEERLPTDIRVVVRGPRG